MYFTPAAEQGHAISQYWLGVCYYNGHGVDKSVDVAISWFRKSADQGFADAKYLLALALSNREDVDKVEVFNLGTGRGLSVLEILNTFMKVTGVNVPYQIVGRREGDIEQVWAKPDKANNVLGWKADTPIEDVLLSAWKWEQKIRK